jgi:hypothetical protein
MYGDLYKESGDPGQGTANPSECVFLYHAIVQYGLTLYDPSYGKTYNDLLNLQNGSLFGFCGFPTDYSIRVRSTTGSLGLGFR